MKPELVKLLRKIDIVCPQRVRLKHAGDSGVYYNVKKAFGCPEALNLMADEIRRKIGSDVSCIAAAGYGGIPLAAVISSRHKIPLISIRDEEKKHGLRGFVENYFPNSEDRVGVIDDVFSTGKGLRETMHVIHSMTPAKVVGCYVVLKRGEGKLDVPLHYLLTPEILLGKKEFRRLGSLGRI